MREKMKFIFREMKVQTANYCDDGEKHRIY